MSGRQTDRSELSASARSLVLAARDADGPKPEDRERVRRALAVALAASAGTAGATVTTAGGAKALAGATATTASAGATATSVASVATASIFTKVAIAVVALGVGSGAIVAVHHYGSANGAANGAANPAAVPMEIVAGVAAPARRTHVVAPPVLEIPEDFELPSEALPTDALPTEALPTDALPTEAPTAEEPMPVAAGATHRAHVRADPASDEVSVQDEYDVLRDALNNAATPERRLASVDMHAARFPSGQMAQERERVRRRAVDALCAEGPEAVTRYLAAHPTSASASLLRETCGAH